MPALISARNRGSWASLRPRSARKRARWTSRIELLLRASFTRKRLTLTQRSSARTLTSARASNSRFSVSALSAYSGEEPSFSTKSLTNRSKSWRKAWSGSLCASWMKPEVRVTSRCNR